MAIWTALAGALSVTDTIATLVTSTSVVDGTGVDTSAFEGDIIIHASAIASASDTLTFAVEYSYDNSSFTAVAADALVTEAGAATTLGVTTDAPANSSQTVYLKKERSRRYVRVTATATGSGISIPCVVSIIGQKKYANI